MIGREFAQRRNGFDALSRKIGMIISCRLRRPPDRGRLRAGLGVAPLLFSSGVADRLFSFSVPFQALGFGQLSTVPDKIDSLIALFPVDDDSALAIGEELDSPIGAPSGVSLYVRGSFLMFATNSCLFWVSFPISTGLRATSRLLAWAM